MAATHEGHFLTFWEQRNIEGNGVNTCGITDFLTSEGSGWEDITGTPAGELYTPEPNSCVVRAFGTLAEMQAIEADPNHFAYWYDEIPPEFME